MSLQIWLPLNGDLHNQGLSDLVVSECGATINQNGKIGQCYSFNNTYIKLVPTAELKSSFSTEGSISLWVKVSSSHNSWAQACTYGTVGTSWNNILFGIDINASGIPILNASTGSAYTNCNSNVAIKDDKWHHIVGVFNSGNLAIYIDGIQKKTVTTSNTPAWASASIISIGGNSSEVFKNNDSINDVRIYNHALSDKEIKEIAKGLVLHYKLDNIDINNATNLITSITAGGQTTVSNGVITTSGLDKDTYFTLNLSENIVNGTNYILSCDAEIPEGYYWRFPLGNQSNSAIPFVIYNGYNIFSFTANDIDWGTKRLFFDDNVATVRSSGKITKLWNFKLIKTGGIIQDCSGYSNNATITGTTNLVTSSARYNYSISMNNVNTSNHIESISDLILPTDAITATCWVKAAKATNHVIFVFPQLEFGTLNSLGYVNLSSAPGFTLTNFKDNDWNFIVVIRQGTTYKLYINGIIETQNGANNYYLHNGNKLYLLNRNYNNNYAGNANISDFRIYATALSEEDILDLYHTPMSIDNKGNIYTRELVEI